MSQLDPQRQRQFAIEVVRRLRARGYEALWAGGCVRDQLLGEIPKDYDVATNAQPDEVRQIFGPRKTVAVGAAFGVIKLIGPESGGHVEVVTFRQDKSYSDHRRPDSIEFSTAEEDAKRRDFTINGLFYDPIDERVIDYVGGQEDLDRKVVRAIGNPAERFAEDKLRLLRAARFAATLDFQLDIETRRAVERLAGEIVLVSAERIAIEMRLMLVHRARVRAIELLRELGLLAVVVPEVALESSDSPATWLETLAVLQHLARPSFPLALAALVHRFVSMDQACELCRRWKLSNADTREVEWLVRQQAALDEAQRLPWPRLQRMLTAPGIADLLALHEARAHAAGRDSGSVEYCRGLLRLPKHELDPEPILTGDDLIAHRVPRGKFYQTLLEAVRDAQLDKRIKTKEEALALVDSLLARGARPEE